MTVPTESALADGLEAEERVGLKAAHRRVLPGGGGCGAREHGVMVQGAGGGDCCAPEAGSRLLVAGTSHKLLSLSTGECKLARWDDWGGCPGTCRDLIMLPAAWDQVLCWLRRGESTQRDAWVLVPSAATDEHLPVAIEHLPVSIGAAC